MRGAPVHCAVRCALCAVRCASHFEGFGTLFGFGTFGDVGTFDRFGARGGVGVVMRWVYRLLEAAIAC